MRKEKKKNSEKVSVSAFVNMTKADRSREQEAERQLAHSFLSPSLIHAPAG